MTEYHDDMPVTQYEARFAGRGEIPPGFGEKLYKGHVAVFLVATTVNNNKAEYLLRKDFEDEKTRRYILDVEDMVPLTGALREQSIVFLANGGQEGALSFGSANQAEIAMDRIQKYLAASWPGQLPAELTHENFAKAVIEQLENYIAGVAPRPLPEPVSPELEAVDEVFPGAEEVTVIEASDPEPEPVVTEPEVEREPETVPPEQEVQQDPPTPEPVAVDVAALKARMEAEENRGAGTLKVGKPVNDGLPPLTEELDDDGFPITVMDEVEVVGSVYPPGHTGANREFIDNLERV